MSERMLISSYTCADAIADGLFVDVMEDEELAALVREAGFKLPFAVTASVLSECIELNERSHVGESRAGRWWDILHVLNWTLPKDFRGPAEHGFKLSVSGRLVSLVADFTFDDAGRPAVTILFLHER